MLDTTSKEVIMSAVTVDMVIAAFLETREEIEAIEKEAQAKVAGLKELQERRRMWLDGKMRESGVTNMSIKDVGTCFYQTKESVTMGDWDVFFGFVKENEAWELLNHAVNKTAALEVMGSQRQLPPPPGVNYVAVREVHVRRK